MKNNNIEKLISKLNIDNIQATDLNLLLAFLLGSCIVGAFGGIMSNGYSFRFKGLGIETELTPNDNPKVARPR